MLKETLRSTCRSVCALALAVSLTSDGNSYRQGGQLPGVETPVQYYPELENFPLKEQGSFTTRKGTRIDWYNYIDHTFNPDAAREMFSYFQDLVPAKGLTIPMIYRGGVQQVILFPREGIQQSAIFITPENAPRPSTWGFQGDGYPSSATLNIPDHKVVASYVNFRRNTQPNVLFTSNIDFVNRRLAVEACQQFILIGGLADSRPLNEQIAGHAQEGLCNSLGVAFALKQRHVPYDFYRRVTSIRSGFGYELIILEEKSYNGIPFTGPIV